MVTTKWHGKCFIESTLSHITGRSSALAAPHIFSNYECNVFRAPDKLYQGKPQTQEHWTIRVGFCRRHTNAVSMHRGNLSVRTSNGFMSHKCGALANRQKIWNEKKNNFRWLKKKIEHPFAHALRQSAKTESATLRNGAKVELLNWSQWIMFFVISNQISLNWNVTDFMRCRKTVGFDGRDRSYTGLCRSTYILASDEGTGRRAELMEARAEREKKMVFTC